MISDNHREGWCCYFLIPSNWSLCPFLVVWRKQLRTFHFSTFTYNECCMKRVIRLIIVLINTSDFILYPYNINKKEAYKNKYLFELFECYIQLHNIIINYFICVSLASSWTTYIGSFLLTILLYLMDQTFGDFISTQ